MEPITTALGTIKIAYDLAKELQKTESAIKDSEFKLKIAELMETLANVKVQLIKTQEENSSLKQEIKELQSKLTKHDEVEFRDGYYYITKPIKGEPEGPFCQHCYSSKKELSLLIELSREFWDMSRYSCPACKNHYK